MRPLIISIATAFVASLSAPAIAAKSSGNARSAVSGKYVSKGYAAKNQKTTVVEQKGKK